MTGEAGFEIHDDGGTLFTLTADEAPRFLRIMDEAHEIEPLSESLMALRSQLRLPLIYRNEGRKGLPGGTRGVPSGACSSAGPYAALVIERLKRAGDLLAGAPDRKDEDSA